MSDIDGSQRRVHIPRCKGAKIRYFRCPRFCAGSHASLLDDSTAIPVLLFPSSAAAIIGDRQLPPDGCSGVQGLKHSAWKCGFEKNKLTVHSLRHALRHALLSREWTCASSILPFGTAISQHHSSATPHTRWSRSHRRIALKRLLSASQPALGEEYDLLSQLWERYQARPESRNGPATAAEYARLRSDACLPAVKASDLMVLQFLTVNTPSNPPDFLAAIAVARTASNE